MTRTGELIILFFTIPGICVTALPCGPEGDCDCNNSRQNVTEMRCSKPLELKSICESLGNCTFCNVTKLISKLNNTNLTTNDFTGCETLREIYLANSNLKHIQENALFNMSELTDLDLSCNSLDIYRNGRKFEFWLPHNLRILKLNGNVPENSNIEHLKYPVFHPSDALQQLYIDGLPNKDLDVFRGNSNVLQNLTTSGKSGYCTLIHVTNNTFGALQNLTFLNISSCNLAMIELGAFKQLPKLEVLDLSYNRLLGLKALQNISYGLQFTNIKSFNYSHCDRMFGPARTVKKRDVCYLWNTTLEELVIEGNRIQMVESNALILLPSTLQVLHIGYNRLTIAVYILQLGCLSNLTNLHSGFLDTFALLENPFEIMSDISKDEDDCRNNETSTCSFMTDNQLRQIAQGKPDCLFYDGSNIPLSIPMRVKEIYAPQCGFVSALFSILKYAGSFKLPMELLDVSGNNIYTLPSLLISVEQLKYLDLSDNHCSSLDPRSGMSIPNLEHLHLQKNLLGFSVSDYQFTYFSNLKMLNLSDNVLKNLPEQTFFNLTNLKVLDLSCNKIQNWTADVSTMKSLTHLNLSNNVIGNLPSSLMIHFEKKQNFSVDLQNNTIKYTCEYKDFLRWLVKYKKHMVGYKTYKFYDEDDTELTVDKFEDKVSKLGKHCSSYIGYIVMASLFTATFLISVLCGIIYRNRWQIRYFVYMTKRRYFSYKRIPDERQEEHYKYDAFISYAEDNDHFISEELVPNLEQHGLSLCVHQRDFVPGRSVIDNIIGAIQSSRKTVAILSREFISSRWCMYEFQMARMESIYSRDDKGCLLIVMKDTIKIEDMPLEMMNWIRYESYLEYTEQIEGELLFWERLKESLKDL